MAASKGNAPKSKASSSRVRSAKPAAKKPAGRVKLSATVMERARVKRATRIKHYSIAGSLFALMLLIWTGVQQRWDRDIANYAHYLWLDGTESAGFRFSELLLEGRHLTEPDRVIQVVGLDVGDSLFMVSLDAIRARLLELDTVKDAHVSRDLSGSIKITLIERKPFVLWQYRDTLRVMDEEGIVLQREDPSNYPHLITMVGREAPAHIEHLVSFLATDSDLAKQVTAAIFVSDRRWDVRVAGGIRVLLPEHDPKAAWKRLATMQREHGILQQEVRAIDLRIHDRIFITLPDNHQQILATEREKSGASDV